MSNTITLTPLESQVLEELFCSASGNGHDFGFIEDAGIPSKQARGVVASLAKKGIIQIWDPVTNECGTFTQFTWKHLPDGQYPDKVEDILPKNTDVVFPTNPDNMITTMSNQSNTNTNNNTNNMDNNNTTSLTKAIKEILVSLNGVASTKEVLSHLQSNYPNVKASYRPVFGTLRRLGALASKAGQASQEVAQVAEAQVEVQVEEAKAEVAALEAEVDKPVRRRNAKGHFIKG
jgi:hypothetical protein